jgi:hypothetical protein
MPNTENADPMRPKDLKDNVAPKCTKSITDKAEPSRAKDLSDNVEPKLIKSKTDSDDAKCE